MLKLLEYRLSLIRGKSPMGWHQAISWLDKNVEFWLNFLFYVYLSSILVIEVIARFVFDHSLTWSVETAIYAFIWLTYLSMAEMTRSRDHLAFTMIRDRLNRHGQFVCLAISDVALAIVAITIIVYIVQPIGDSVAFNQKMTGSELPLWLALAAIPVGWTVVLLRVVQRFLDLLRNYRRGKPLIAAKEIIIEG
jgi:TRAP-type C4-dicarboxylate transport system permease small subunit